MADLAAIVQTHELKIQTIDERLDRIAALIETTATESKLRMDRFEADLKRWAEEGERRWEKGDRRAEAADRRAEELDERIDRLTGSVVMLDDMFHSLHEYTRHAVALDIRAYRNERKLRRKEIQQAEERWKAYMAELDKKFERYFQQRGQSNGHGQ